MIRYAKDGYFLPLAKTELHCFSADQWAVPERISGATTASETVATTKHPEVIAVNKFRRAMSGKPETIYANTDGSVIEVTRGASGAALINISEHEQEISMPTTMPDGNYTDGVHNATFNVTDGIIRGRLSGMSSYILTN